MSNPITAFAAAVIPALLGTLNPLVEVMAEKSTKPLAPDNNVCAVESMVKSAFPVDGAVPDPPPWTITCDASAADAERTVPDEK